MSRYEAIIHESDIRKCYHAYVLENEGTKNEWPGEWWGEVFPPWGSSSVSENMLTEWLQKEYPNRSWAIEEVVWIAQPTKWRESNGSTSYLGAGYGAG